MIIEVHSVSFIFRLLILFIDLIWFAHVFLLWRQEGLRLASCLRSSASHRHEAQRRSWPLLVVLLWLAFGRTETETELWAPWFLCYVSIPTKDQSKKSKQISHFLHTSKILASPRLWCPSSWSLSNTQDVQLGHFKTPITDHPINAGPSKKGGTSCKDKDDMITVRTTYTNSRKSKTCSNSKALRALQNISQEAHKRSSS